MYLQILDSQPHRKKLTTANINNKAEAAHTLMKQPAGGTGSGTVSSACRSSHQSDGQKGLCGLGA